MRKADEKKPRGNIVLHSIFKLAFLVFVLYSLISIISVQITISENKDELLALQKKEDELVEKNGEYERLLNVSDQKEYMEKLAIDKLGYAYPNETRFYDVSRN